MIIRDARASDLETVLDVERRAFAQDEEAELVCRLASDPSAEPSLSLLALCDDRPVGHVLFTAAAVETGAAPVAVSLLAPLAVVPEAQGQGVGRRLVEAGFARLRSAGVGLAFVLGDPAYYGRFGFKPAIPHGLEPPFELPAEHADAWQVHAFAEGALGEVQGRVRCADAFLRPELWSA